MNDDGYDSDTIKNFRTDMERQMAAMKREFLNKLNERLNDH